MAHAEGGPSSSQSTTTQPPASGAGLALVVANELVERGRSGDELLLTASDPLLFMLLIDKVSILHLHLNGISEEF